MALEALEREQSLSEFEGGVDELTILLESLGMEIYAVGREGVFVDGVVPFDLIDNEEVPVHVDWAESLARDMRQVARNRGGTGQKAPVVLGLVPEGIKLHIMDGFHRSSAIKHE